MDEAQQQLLLGAEERQEDGPNRWCTPQHYTCDMSPPVFIHEKLQRATGTPADAVFWGKGQ